MLKIGRDVAYTGIHILRDSEFQGFVGKHSLGCLHRLAMEPSDSIANRSHRTLCPPLVLCKSFSKQSLREFHQVGYGLFQLQCEMDVTEVKAFAIVEDAENGGKQGLGGR